MEPIQPDNLSAEELLEAWSVLSPEERVQGFQILGHRSAESFFLSLGTHEQSLLLESLAPDARRTWMRLLAPDDAADVIQENPEMREPFLALLDETTRREVAALLAYAEDDAGGLMSPRFARLRPDMSIDEAISYLRRQARERLETIYYAYALDSQQKLMGVVSFRELFGAQPGKRIADIMRVELITVPEHMDQENVSRLFSQTGLVALPVVDEAQRMKGIVTVDDIVDVVQEEATEDIQKAGGMEAMDAPYFDISFGSMLKKRAGWLTILFFGEMLTATAMGRFEGDIAKATVLSLFVPLIISSGGNSGSQASTLIIRAMALREVKLRDWYRVMRRELGTGLSLGLFLGLIGLLRIVFWHYAFGAYPQAPVLIGLTVGISVLGVVMWGTLAGSMLPFLLRRLGLDPASASAPFVATLVDVSGLIIYFTVASLLLTGTLL